MSPPLRPILLLVALVVANPTIAQKNTAAPLAPAPMKVPTISTDVAAAFPAEQSPVDFFRKLLQTPPADRRRLLGNRSAAAQNRIYAKITEYEALPPQERELRLRATELRWYLMPLMRESRTNRTALLARVPADLLPLVKSRLMQWDILPPPLQTEFWANDSTLRYFVQATPAAASDAQHNKTTSRVEQFFAFTPDEKERLLGALSEPERAQMEKTLQTFDQLAPQQRLMCVRNYAKFAGMSDAERAEFLKNAESWSKMSSEERHTWQDLVANVPEWPPLPPLPIMPPPLPPPLPITPPSDAPNAHVATN
jgi:hypothetical protein